MNAKKEWELAEAMTLGVFDEDNWVTINGTHVLIGEGGEIKGGPEALKNYKKGEKSSKKSEAKKESAAELYNRVIGNYGAKDPAQVARLLEKNGYTITGVTENGVSYHDKNGEAGSINLSKNKEGRYIAKSEAKPNGGSSESTGSNKQIEFDHPEGADKVKGYVGNERVAELAEKALRKKGDEGLHRGYELDRIDSITVFPPDDDYKEYGSQLIVSYTATNKKTGKTEQFESHPYVKAFSGGKKTKYKDYADFPKSVTYEGKEYFKENKSGEMKSSSGGKAHSYVRWDDDNNAEYVTVSESGKISRDSAAEEMSLIMDMMAGDWDPDQPRDENGRWSDTGASDYDDDDDDGDEVTGRLEEFQNGWWGRRNELEDDLEAAGFSVDDANDEYISVSIEDDDEDRSFALYLGGTPSTITINSIKEF